MTFVLAAVVKNIKIAVEKLLKKEKFFAFLSKEAKNFFIQILKGEKEMNACAMKPGLPFVTNMVLSRTPASEDNKKMTEFINSHEFSFDIDPAGKLISVVTNKSNQNGN